MTAEPLRLYIDANVLKPDGREATVSFGPFFERPAAEGALARFIGRENAMGATIRNPDA